MLDLFLHKLAAWLTLPSTAQAVMLPLVVWLSAAALCKTSRRLLDQRWHVLALALSVATSFWSEAGMHVLPVFSLMFAGWLLYQERTNPGALAELDAFGVSVLVGKTTFLQMLVTDFVGGVTGGLTLQSGRLALDFFGGTGGFGWADALVLTPLMCAMQTLGIVLFLQSKLPIQKPIQSLISFQINDLQKNEAFGVEACLKNRQPKRTQSLCGAQAN